MPVFFIHDPAQGIVTPLDRKYRVRDIPPTSELTEINRIHPKVESTPTETYYKHSGAQSYEQNIGLQEGGLGLVSDYMSHPILSITQDKTLSHAWAKMIKYEIHHLAIVNEQQELVGMLTESAILAHRMRPESRSPEQTPLTEFVLKNVLSTSPDAAIEDLAVGLLELGLSGVPVTDNGMVTGMITRSDVLKIFLSKRQLNTQI